MLKPLIDSAPKGGVSATLSTHLSTHNPAMVEYSEPFLLLDEKGILIGCGRALRSFDAPKFCQGCSELVHCVNITSDGAITFLRQVGKENPKPFLGRPSVKFQGVCQSGLITGIVGSESYVLSLSKTRP